MPSRLATRFIIPKNQTMSPGRTSRHTEAITATGRKWRRGAGDEGQHANMLFHEHVGRVTDRGIRVDPP